MECVVFYLKDIVVRITTQQNGFYQLIVSWLNFVLYNFDQAFNFLSKGNFLLPLHTDDKVNT